MIKVSVLTILLLQFLRMLVEVSSQSDCSQYFTYVTEPSGNETWGQVSIPSPPKNVELHLIVGLSIAVRLSNSYIGQIELAQSKEDSIRAIEQDRPLLYYICFPLRQPIPVITGIWLNNQLYCTGPHAYGVGSIVTSIVLEHFLYPPQMRSNFTTSMAQPSAESTKELTRRPTTNSSPEPDQNSDECGRSFTNITINQLISTKVRISPGEWPWLVAIFHVREAINYKCTGTLLTNRHILTVAPCLEDRTVNIPPVEILASLDRYRLIGWQERESVNRLVEKYTFHPEYHPDSNSDSPLAIVVLRTSVAYSPTIKPICLWSGSSDLQRIVGKSGYVVGWGKDELHNGFYTEEPRMSRAPVVSQLDCLMSAQVYSHVTTHRTFCAGLRSSGSDPCNGDYGSGLMLYNSITGRYELRGVVITTFLNSRTFSCADDKYVVYADVAKHMDWINQQISMK